MLDKRYRVAGPAGSNPMGTMGVPNEQPFVGLFLAHFAFYGRDRGDGLVRGDKRAGAF